LESARASAAFQLAPRRFEKKRKGVKKGN